MSEFDDIRPYNDSEVPAVIARLIADPEFIDLLLSRKLPVLAKICPWLLRPLLRRTLSKAAQTINSVDDLQRYITGSLKALIGRTTDGYSVSGLENLDPNKAYLFLSNHRDIALDPAMVNLVLSDAGMATVRIAIGDNLLSKPFASDLMRVNRSFIVKRSITGRRDKLEALKKLSRYIRHSISSDGVSVWIAQREGRAKDGHDRTETALLKMLALSKNKETSFAQATAELNLVPVAISYEYDPCDVDKGRELYAKAQGEEYVKQEFEDLDTIQKGFVGYKGRIHIAFGDPVADQYENADSLAEEIDCQVYTNYKLFPSNIIACQILGYTENLERVKSQWPDHNWQDEELNFNVYLNRSPSLYRKIITEGYAAPVLNYLKVKQAANTGS
ncbi:MAG: 1-acyl-sn-glycerol-3-phosphate acyltransferase [Porticoccaceae bacterium]|nr:1-acyl-sn-glycerol-3-phosphate acyltransferase [Porticoccaceae bacterium]